MNYFVPSIRYMFLSMLRHGMLGLPYGRIGARRPFVEHAPIVEHDMGGKLTSVFPFSQHIMIYFNPGNGLRGTLVWISGGVDNLGLEKRSTIGFLVGSIDEYGGWFKSQQ